MNDISLIEKPLTILHLEDDPRDAQLIQACLEGNNILCKITRAQTREEFESLLSQGGWDLILSDFSLPSFDGLAALAQVQEKCSDIPFILISGTIGEDIAVQSLHQGATDYLLKQRLERLPSAVRRAVQEAKERSERRRAEQAQREAEQRYRQIFDRSIEGIFQTTPEGRFLMANAALARILGYSSPEELITQRTNIRFQGYVDPAARDEFRRLVETHGSVQNFEYQACRKDGSPVWISENAQTVRDAEGRVLYYEGTIIDITERKQAEETLRQSQEHFRRVIEDIFRFVPEALLVFTDDLMVLKHNLAFEHLIRNYAARLHYTEVELKEKLLAEIRAKLPAGDRGEIRIPAKIVG